MGSSNKEPARRGWHPQWQDAQKGKQAFDREGELMWQNRIMTDRKLITTFSSSVFHVDQDV
jgi:hypothetical protein